ncbi:metallophosphoesterase [Streptomyces sp. NPDC052101]|uniref:metallophosphoesterase n=1 Tax=Streptomyces sp. NPDC052101 TaxID=3155763 RepID=UPI0034374955
MNDQTVVVCPDSQNPKHDPVALKAIVEFIADIQPTGVIHIGDALDFEGPARWTKDTRKEYAGNVEQEAEGFTREFIESVRAVHDGFFGIHEGNHDLRPRQYLEKYAPALADSKFFNLENLCRFEDYGVRRLPDFYEVFPDVITTHGHLGRIRLAQVAGMTALNAAKRFTKSVVMGHTHRAAAIPHTLGIGAPKTIWGVEVGHIMDESCADYLKGSPGDWQKAFGVLHYSKSGNFLPEIVYMDSNNEFEFGGYRYLQEGVNV